MGSIVSLAYNIEFVNITKKLILCYAKSMKKMPFKEKVYQVVAKIPKGQTLSYKQVAELAGSPKAYRAVGNIMHNNPGPKKVPCHRVIASQGKIGGYASGVTAKIKKLKQEGVKIKDNKII